MKKKSKSELSSELSDAAIAADEMVQSVYTRLMETTTKLAGCLSASARLCDLVTGGLCDNDPSIRLERVKALVSVAEDLAPAAHDLARDWIEAQKRRKLLDETCLCGQPRSNHYSGQPIGSIKTATRDPEGCKTGFWPKSKK